MVFRPATPGFLVTLAATACLAVVSFGVPWLKSVYFLQASINSNGTTGSATFGVLGYCFETGGTTACSKAAVGWEFNPNTLLGINLPFNVEIPNVVVKWLTYVLILHIVGLCLAAVASLFGLLAHVREMAMTCFSTCISGIAASVTLIAFIFDVIFFLLIRTRIRAIGGTANLGNGFWLTLAAWVMLFFAGFFFGFGRCCMSNRPRAPKSWKGGKDNNNTGGISHSEAMRLEAVKAEAERKARQAEVGLPAFPTNSESVPLKKPDAQYYVEDDSDDDPAYAGGPGPRRKASVETAYTTNYAGRGRGQPVQYAGGYVQGPPGTRTIDAYNNNGPSYPPAGPGYPPTGPGFAPTGPGYPPTGPNYPPTGPNYPPSGPGYPPAGPQRQPSANSGYSSYPNYQSSSPPPMPLAPTQQFLSPNLQPGEVYPGHGNSQSSYHSAVSHIPGQASSYSQFDQGREASYGGNSADPYYPAPSGNPQTAPYGASYNQNLAPSEPPIPPAKSPRPYPTGFTSDSSHSPVHAINMQYTSDLPYNSGQYSSAPPARPGTAQSRPGTAPSRPGTGYVDAQPGYRQDMPGGQRSPTSPSGHVPAPWQGNSSAVPSEAPPGYDVPMAPGAYPKEKR